LILTVARDLDFAIGFKPDGFKPDGFKPDGLSAKPLTIRFKAGISPVDDLV